MPSKTEEYLTLAQRTADGLDPVLGKLDGLPDHRIPVVQIPLFLRNQCLEGLEMAVRVGV